MPKANIPRRVRGAGNGSSSSATARRIITAALGHPELAGRFAASYHFVDLPEASHENKPGANSRAARSSSSRTSACAGLPLRAAMDPCQDREIPILRFASRGRSTARTDRRTRRRAAERTAHAFHALRRPARPPARQIAIPKRASRRIVLAVDRRSMSRAFNRRARMLSLDRDFDALSAARADRFRHERLFRATRSWRALYRR